MADVYIASEPFSSIMLLRKKATWYSMNDGNWIDPNTWRSNKLDRKNVQYPQDGDDVFIFHNVTCNTAVNSTTTLNNLTITGKLIYGNSGVTITVNGELNCTGTIDQSVQSGGILIIRGYNTIISTYLSNSSSTIHYASFYGYTQPVYPITYQNLSLYSYTTDLSGSGSKTFNNTKYLGTDLVVNGNLSLGCILDSQGFNITVNGQTNTTLNKSTILSTTSILFVGQIITAGNNLLTVTGGAGIECRGGFNIADGGSFTASTSNLNFTTNNQTLIINAQGVVNCNSATITGAITISTSASNSNPFIINTTINGTVAGSTLNNNGIMQFNSTSNQMTTGVFNYMNTAGSTMVYNTGTYTLPYTTYEKLNLIGAGTYTFSSNMTINSDFVLRNGTIGSSIADLGSNNLSVGGTTSVSFFMLKKTGAGNLLFTGRFMTGGSGGGSFDFTGGNPTIEFRGGMQLINAGVTTLWGSGAISYTTNNQTVDSYNTSTTLNGNITIASGITVTALSTSIGVLTIAGVLNGATSTSTFINNGPVIYTNATAPMATGNFYCNQSTTGTFTYGASGNQDITPPNDPSLPGYYNLTLNGSGAKRLLANVSVKHTYTLTGPATLNSNGFALTNP